MRMHVRGSFRGNRRKELKGFVSRRENRRPRERKAEVKQGLSCVRFVCELAALPVRMVRTSAVSGTPS